MEDHLRVVVGSDGTAERETPQEDRPSRRPQRLRPKRALPTDRAKFDTQTAALRASVTASNRGAEAVTAADMAARIDVSEATAGLMNGFFVEAGFLVREGRGLYKPIAEVNEYARLYGLQPDEARVQLAIPMSRSWYFTEVERELELGPKSEDVLINVLSRAAGADGDRRPQLELVLDWLEYVDLIERDGGMVKLVGTPETPRPNGTPPPLLDPDPDPGTTMRRAKTPEPGSQVLGFKFEFSLTADDLQKLTPEQITATFEAVGKVMAIKAAIDKE